MRNLFFVFLIFFLPFNGSSEINLPDTAIASLSDSISAIRNDTLYKAACYNRGLNLYKAEKFPEAVLCFDTCLTFDSSFTDARFIRALSLEKKGDLKEAMMEFERIKKKSPDYDQLDKRIKNYQLTVYLSKNWYYMLAMLFVVILLMAVVVKAIAYKRVH